MFTSNQRQFYRNLEGNTEDAIPPNAEEARRFWNNIWGKAMTYNAGAQWLREVESDLAGKQAPISISVEDVIYQVKARLPNWEIPGPDGILMLA